jgi:DNA-binding LacI/PurR family transcriptional regulator
MAVAALGVARDLGVSVPDDLSVVAGDDSPLCLIGQPAITALSRDVAAYGAQTARTLLDAIKGVAPESVVVDPPRLEVRGSTAPPR